MDTGKGIEPSVVNSSSSSNSLPLAGNGSGGGNGNGEQEQVSVPIIIGNGSRDNVNVEQPQVVVRRETHVSMDSLILSLSPPMFIDDLNIVPPPPQPPPPPPALRPAAAVLARAPRRNHPRNPTVPPPYPWATNQRAIVHSLDHLIERGIYTISGDVHCKKCKRNFTIEFDLLSKFNEIKQYIIIHRNSMHDRAPTRWTNPDLPTCMSCQYPHSLRPTFGKKRTINWLFLMLSQMMGMCSIAQLKYFCKHTNNHRTGAKDRLLFLTYLGVCKQLQDIPAFQYPIQ